jgi:DNA-binding CsgD family transcriptional regulator
VDLRLAALWAEAEIALIAGEPSAAAAISDRALSIAEGCAERAQVAPFAVTGVRALLRAGRPADAARWLDRLTSLLAGTAWAGTPAIEHARGHLALAEGSTGIARSALERAVAGWDTAGRTWEALWARLDLATVLVRSSRYVDAAILVGDVRERAQRLDSRPLLDRADEIARQARGHITTAEPWHPLTARELEVARLIATGLTNPAIAEELGISPKTVSAHVEHILAKLGVARRAEVAAWVALLGDRGRGASPARVPSPEQVATRAAPAGNQSGSGSGSGR